MPEGNAKSVSGTRHTTQGVPYEWHAVAHGDETYVVRDVPGRHGSPSTDVVGADL